MDLGLCGAGTPARLTTAEAGIPVVRFVTNPASPIRRRQADRSVRSTWAMSLVLDRPRIPLRKLPLMPVRINRRDRAGAVQFRNLLRSQVPSHGVQVLPQLLLIPRPANHGRNR